VSFHTFPKNIILKKKWEHALKMNIINSTNNINVCSKHFIKDDFLQFKTSNYYYNYVATKTNTQIIYNTYQGLGQECNGYYFNNSIESYKL